jgi:tetratricopeptide (TPR) repeat protein
VGIVAGLVAVAAAVILGPRLFQNGSGTQAGTLENSVAVMPFQNLQDPEDSERLGQILQELVIADLSGSTNLKVFSSQRLYDVQKQIGSEDRQFDRETASRIADRVGAQTMLEGTLSKLGEKWILTATVTDADAGTVAGSCRVDGSDLYQMVDDLSRHLRNEPRLAMTAPADKSVRERTTGSLDAYRLYLVGSDLLNREDLNREDYGAAADTLALAVEADPSFGSAYYKLGMAQWWATQLDAYTNEEAQQPLKHLLDNGLYANRQERLLAEAAYELIGQNWDEAQALYEQVCGLYAEDKEAWYGLGEAQFHSEKVADAVTLASFERAVDLDPSFTVAYQHIFDCNGRLGKPDASMQRVRRFLAANPDREVGYRWWVEVAHAAGREDEMETSLAEARKRVTEPRDWYKVLVTAARVSNERGDFVRGRRLLLEAKEASPDDVGFQWTALTTWTAGEMRDYDEVERQFAEMETKWPEQAPYLWEGKFDLYLLQGEKDEARAFLEEIRGSERYAKKAGKFIYADRLLGDEEKFRAELDRQLAHADSDAKKADLLNGVGSKTLELTGDCEEARPWLEQSLALDAENGWSHTSMGWCQLREGSLDAAAESFRKASEHSPGHSMPRLGLAAVEMARRRPAEAERAYRELLDGRVEARALRWLSSALAEQGRFEEAESTARQVVGMNPSRENKTQLAWVLIAGDRDLEEGVALATEAREMELSMFRDRHLELDFVASPEHCLGLAAVKRGEVDEGVALLEEAAELRPDRSRIQEDLRKARALP